MTVTISIIKSTKKAGAFAYYLRVPVLLIDKKDEALTEFFRDHPDSLILVDSEIADRSRFAREKRGQTPFLLCVGGASCCGGKRGLTPLTP